MFSMVPQAVCVNNQKMIEAAALRHSGVWQGWQGSPRQTVAGQWNLEVSVSIVSRFLFMAKTRTHVTPATQLSLCPFAATFWMEVDLLDPSDPPSLETQFAAVLVLVNSFPAHHSHCHPAQPVEFRRCSQCSQELLHQWR